MYDDETGFYYLRARYDDPVVKRFLNADDADIIDGANANILFDYFSKVGINIHNPLFGSWVDRAHQSWSRAYNDAWELFIATKPTVQQIFEKAVELAKQFGFEVHF